MVWKEKHDRIKKQLDALSQRYAKLEKMYGDLMRKKNNLEAEVKTIRADQKILKGQLVKAKGETAALDKMKEALRSFFEAVNELSKADKSIIPWSRPTSTPTSVPTAIPTTEMPSEVAVDIEQPALIVNVRRKPLTLSQDDLLGRIAIVYAEGLLPTDKAFTLRYLNRVMEQRFGRKEAFANFGKVLNKLVAWGFFEKVQAGKRWDYRLKMKPGEAREKGLLKTIEKVEA